jgi:hypothetical protein
MKATATLACLLISLNTLFAQTRHSREWTISAGPNIASLQRSLTQNQPFKPGLGGNLGLAYTHFFTAGFGLSLGLEAAIHNTSFRANALSVNYQIPTPPGLSGDFLLNGLYSNLNETQSMLFLQLPLMLNAQLPLGRSAFLYLSGGGKYALPLFATYKQTATSLTTTGYSTYTGQTYHDMLNHGFTTYDNLIISQKLRPDPAILLALETGLKWKLTPKTHLYTGAYLDLGLRPLLKNPTLPLLEYNPETPSIYRHNSILQTTAHTLPPSEIKSFVLGIKIKLAFSSGLEHARATALPAPKKEKPKPLLGAD